MNAVLDASSVPDSPAKPESPRSDSPALPEWFARSQRDAWQTYSTLPPPSRRDEDWRFADLGSLQFDDFRRQPAADPGTAALLGSPAVRLVFSNDVLVSESRGDAAVEALTLREALRRHGNRLTDVLAPPDTGLGGAKFAALHQSQLLDAVVVVVPDGVEIAHPVEIVHWLSGERGAAFPRTIVLAGERSKVTVLEHHLAPSGTVAVSCGAAQLIASAGSQIHYSLLNELPAGAQSLHFSTVRCARDAAVKHALVNLGDGRVRTECLSHVSGEGGRSDMLSVSVPRARQEIDQRTLQHHAAPRTFSDLLYKNILSDAARSIFAGLIRVDDGAHFTDAYQKCRNLLLSDDSEANSMPGLEINADNVKCSHGATCGRIDGEQVFYFASRGIPEVQAAQLIATGFAAEVIEAIDHPEVRDLLRARLESRFAQLAGLPAAQRDVA